MTPRPRGDELLQMLPDLGPDAVDQLSFILPSITAIALVSRLAMRHSLR